MVPGIAMEKTNAHKSGDAVTIEPVKSSFQPEAQGFTYNRTAPKFDNVKEERQYLKERLALAYRVFAHMGLCELASGHLTVRDPEHPDCFWVTPFGRHFSMMRASDLLLIDHQDKVVAGGYPERQVYNQAAFTIHAAIHQARPDANAVCHSHSPYGKAFSVLGRNLPYYTQDACVFYNDVALYSIHGGVVLDMAESARICKALGSKKALILANHGLLTTGKSIESATAWFISLENECRTALMADAAAAGHPENKPTEILPEAAQFTFDATGDDTAGYFEALPYFDLLDELSNGAYKL